MKFGEEHRAALEDVFAWRRDVRHFRTDPIDAAVMERLKGQMEFAPSVGNARPWRVISVESRAVRDQIIANFDSANAAAADRYDTETQQEYRSLKLAGLRDAPVQLAVFTDMDVSEGRGLGRQTMPEMLTYSTAMAIYTLWLAARAENVGVGWVSILDPVEVTRILDVPKSWVFTGYLCLGYSVEDADTPLLHRAGWQEDTRRDWDVI